MAATALTYTRAQLADALQVSVRTVSRHAGVIPGRLPLKRWDRRAVDRWVAAGMPGVRRQRRRLRAVGG